MNNIIGLPSRGSRTADVTEIQPGAQTNKSICCKSFLISQCPEVDFNKISNSIHKTYIGLTSMLQGFQKCIA